jgi:FkbM family methyltransferase
MTESLLRQQAAALGYRLIPERKLREPLAQLVHALAVRKVDAVVDVGANVGQYAMSLRELGWSGPILSFEPLPTQHSALSRAAENDPEWTIARRVAVADVQRLEPLEISAESDMSSLLPQTHYLRQLSPTSSVREIIEVQTVRLDSVEEIRRLDRQRLFVKLDVQGAEARVLAGMSGLWPRVTGLQIELSMVPLYVGEPPWRETLDRVCALGFSPWLWLPGYFDRHSGRQLQVDVVLFRDDDGSPDCTGIGAVPT